MANTPNFDLYKPNRADTSVEVDTSLSDNFTKIDTELKTNKDGLAGHISNPNAHTSENVSHADGSVKTVLDNHEERLGGIETDAEGLEIRVNDIETLGLDKLAPNLEGRIQTIESDVEGFLAPATFDAMDQQSYTFNEYRIGYVDNKLSDIAYNVKSFGAKGDGVTDDTTSIQNAINALSAGDTLLFPFGTFIIGTLTLSKNINVISYGTIKGKATIGTKPTKADLVSAGSSSARLVLLEGHYPSHIVISPAITVSGSLKMDGVLVKGSITFNCKAEITNSAFHASNVNSTQFGNIYAPNAIVSDAPSAGLYAEDGGRIKAPDAVIVYSGSRGIMAYCGGVINAPRAKVTNNATQGIFILQGGIVIASNGEISNNGGVGINTNYGGTVDVLGATISGNTGAGIGCESNGSVYAENAIITNNTGSGVTTNYGGFIQAKGATITGNASYGAYANGDGTIDILTATIDNTNNAGGVVVRAIGKGQVRSEAAGGTGKATLTAVMYEPKYNTVGFGAAYIGQYSQNDALVYTAGQSLGAPKDVTISNGVITIGTQSWYRLDTEAASATDNLDGIIGGEVGQIIYLQTKAATRDVTVTNNVASTGNRFLLEGGLAFTLDTNRDIIVLKLSTDNYWEEVSRVNVS